VDEVTIEIVNNDVTITTTTTEVVIEAPGPQGATGPAGPQGIPGAAGGTRFHFEQTTPSQVWVINHMLGYHPHVTLTYNGEVGLADVVHNSLDQLSVIHGEPQAGEAELS
jgi:hypothetical protein